MPFPSRSDATAPGQAAARRRVLALHLGLVAGLLAVSIAMWWRVWITGDPASTISCQCGDPAQYLWFIEWVPWSIANLHNPFLSQAIYAGQGGSNTLELSVLLPPLLASPVTALFGPVAAFNVLVTLVPVVNGWCMFVFLRKVTRFVPGQLIASLLFALSPYVVHDDPYGHFNIDLLFFPPLALWCLYDLLVDRRHRPAMVGLGLGALGVAQFFTGTEILAMSALVGMLGAVVVVAVAPNLVMVRLRALAEGLGAAAALGVVALAYPLWYVLGGPRHIVGLPWPGTPAFADPWGAVVQANAEVLSAVSPLAAVGGYFGGSGPAAPFLGIALLIALSVSVLVWRRRRLAWCMAALGILAWGLSLGVPAGGTPSWTPWFVFERVPIVSDIMPARFALFTDLAASVLIAVSLDVCWTDRDELSAIAARVLGSRSRRLRGGGAWWGVLCCAAAIGVLVPIGVTYRPFTVHDDPVPLWFRQVAPKLPAGDVLLTMPYPSSGASQAMAWQADDDFVFAMVGGQAQVPGADGRQSIHVDPLGGATPLLDKLSFGFGSEPSIPPADATTVRSALDGWGVEVFVITSQTRYPPYAIGFMTEVLGRSPQFQDRAWVWYGLGPDPPLPAPARWLRFCARAFVASSPLGVSTCVLQHGAAGDPVVTPNETRPHTMIKMPAAATAIVAEVASSTARNVN